LRAARADCVLLHVEASGLTRSPVPDLDGIARQQQLRRLLILDLITGRVTREHPLFDWLVWHGAAPAILRWLRERAITLDVLGLNFYPQWSTETIHAGSRGQVLRRPSERDGESLPEVLRLYHQRYGAPLMVTETSAAGSDELRSS